MKNALKSWHLWLCHKNDLKFLAPTKRLHPSKFREEKQNVFPTLPFFCVFWFDQMNSFSPTAKQRRFT